MFCGKEGHKKADCKFKTATCSNCGKVGHLRALCRNTNTHEIEKDADEPSPEVTVEAVWCMAVQDTAEDDHCDHIEKHEGSSEHRDGSKFWKKSSRTSRRIRILEKVITNIETDQNSGKSHHEHRDGSESWKKSSRTSRRIKILEKVITNIETDQNSGKSHCEPRDGSTFGTVVPKIAMDEQDSGRGQSPRHRRIRAERVEGSKFGSRDTRGNRDEFDDGSKIGAWKIERNRDELVDGSKNRAIKHERYLMAKSLVNQKLNQDDGVTEHCVDLSGTPENGSEHAACQVKAEEKVVTTWFFDPGADALVMPKCV